MLKLKSIDTEIVLRALAIAAIVFNHAHDFTHSGSFGSGGGMTILMMLSGYSFARFTLEASAIDRASAKALRFGWKLFWPSALLVMFYFVARRQFNLAELLFVSNWLSVNRISIFPVWYIQVIVQMMLGLALLFWIPWVRESFRTRPLASAVCVFLLAGATRYAFPAFVWDTAYLRHQLPHLFLWNFSLGWVIYSCLGSHQAARTPATITLALGCLLVGMLIAWSPSRSDFWLLGLAGAAFILISRVRLPAMLGRIAWLLSQATFVIFLTHRQVLATLIRFFPGSEYRPLFLFIGALAISFAVWFALEAAVRAYRSRHSELSARWLCDTFLPHAPSISRR